MKITIRDMKSKDLPFFNEVRNLVKDYLHNNAEFSLQETCEWFNAKEDDFFIIENYNQKIGYFRTSNDSFENKSIMIGADIHPKFQGNGFSKESYRIFLKKMFEEKCKNKVHLEVLSFNHRAINLYKKIGFKVEGVKRQEILRDGKFIDSILMSMLREEYNA